MSVEENKALVGRFYEGGPSSDMLQKIREGKITKESIEKLVRGIVEDIFSPDVVVHLANTDVNREAIIQGNVESMFAIPDISFTIQKMAAEGDLVAIVGRSRGTHLNTYQRIPATGKKIEMGYMAMLRIAGGKIVEEWIYMDMAGFMQQLGVGSK